MLMFDFDNSRHMQKDMERRRREREEGIESNGTGGSSVGVGLLDVGHKLNQQRLKREVEFKLKERLWIIRKYLRHIAHTLLAFSIFIILNDCVGLSSAPFYNTHVKCKLIEPSLDC